MGYLLPILCYLASSKNVSVGPPVRFECDDKYACRSYRLVERQKFPSFLLEFFVAFAKATDSVISRIIETDKLRNVTDEAVACRAVFVIVSGWDGRTDGRKRFCSQLTN